MDFNLDLQALLWATVRAVLDVLVGFGIPAFAVGWAVDRVLAFVPALRPYREAIIQWVLTRLDQWRLERAKLVVMGTEQQFQAQLKQLQAQGEVHNNRVQALKEERYEKALEAIRNRRIAKDPSQAAELLESAVAALKGGGA